MLVDAFLAGLGEGRREWAAGRAGLADALAEACAAGRAAWPDTRVADAEFATWIGQRVPADATDPVAAIRGVRAADLYLACACARGAPGAIAALDAAYGRGLELALRGMRAGDHVIDEALQQVRERLLVGDGDREPRIADYAGRGDLRRWLRAAAVRTYLNLRRSGKREVLVDDQRVFDAVSTPDVDPELAHMKRLYRDEFKQAFGEAVARLSDQDKNLLRYRHVDRLAIDEIAEIYQVHRATLHRRLASAREALARATEDALRRRLGVADSDLASIRRLVESQVELSLARVLGPDED